jgi:hypothetical protein
VSAVRRSAGTSIRKIGSLLAAGRRTPDPPANAGHHLGGGRPWVDAAADRPPMPPRHSASTPLPPRGLLSVPLPRRGESMQEPRRDRYDSPPGGYGGAVPRRPQAGYWAGQPAPPVVGFGLEAMQGMTNAMNAKSSAIRADPGRMQAGRTSTVRSETTRRSKGNLSPSR